MIQDDFYLVLGIYLQKSLNDLNVLMTLDTFTNLDKYEMLVAFYENYNLILDKIDEYIIGLKENL